MRNWFAGPISADTSSLRRVVWIDGEMKEEVWSYSTRLKNGIEITIRRWQDPVTHAVGNDILCEKKRLPIAPFASSADIRWVLDKWKTEIEKALEKYKGEGYVMLSRGIRNIDDLARVIVNKEKEQDDRGQKGNISLNVS